MATIYDVARRAGVSTKTVSRVLNRDAPVADKTRAAVERAMVELEYIPSLAARSMKSQKSGLIGLITGAISTAADTPAEAGLPEIHIVQGAQRVFENSGKTLLISDTGGNSERVPHLIRTFRQHRVEGLVYVADHFKRIDLDLAEGSMKLVLVNCIDERGTPAVVPDDEDGQLALTRRVIKAGHRRIAYLTLARAVLATERRVAGYRTALEEAGIAFDADMVAASELFGAMGEHQMIWDALDKFLTHANPPTAICCGNDRLAMAVYGILRDRGVSVPDQISVVGYDDHRLVSETLYPALTTAELPYNAMGVRAADLLLNMIAQPGNVTATQPIHVRGQVVERASLKAPPAEGNVYQLRGRNQP